MYEFKTAEHPARFIEDVVPPKSSPYFNVRDDRVQQRSIGYLDTRYMQLRHTVSGGQAVDVVVNPPALASPDFTRVPPLSTFQDLSSIKPVGIGLESLLLELGAGISSAALYFGRMLRDLPWLPKKYALGKGLHTNWNTGTFKRGRWTIPALLISGGIIIGSLPWSGPGIQQGTRGGHSRPGDIVHAQMVQSTHSGEAPSDDQAASTSRNVAPAATAATSSTPDPMVVGPVTVPADPVGGLGGGEVPPIDIPPVTPPSTDPDPLETVIQDVTQPLQPVLQPVNNLL